MACSTCRHRRAPSRHRRLLRRCLALEPSQLRLRRLIWARAAVNPPLRHRHLTTWLVTAEAAPRHLVPARSASLGACRPMPGRRRCLRGRGVDARRRLHRRGRDVDARVAARRGCLGLAFFAGLRRLRARRDLELFPAFVEDVVEEPHRGRGQPCAAMASRSAALPNHFGCGCRRPRKAREARASESGGRRALGAAREGLGKLIN